MNQIRRPALAFLGAALVLAFPFAGAFATTDDGPFPGGAPDRSWAAGNSVSAFGPFMVDLFVDDGSENDDADAGDPVRAREDDVEGLDEDEPEDEDDEDSLASVDTPPSVDTATVDDSQESVDEPTAPTVDSVESVESEESEDSVEPPTEDDSADSADSADSEDSED